MKRIRRSLINFGKYLLFRVRVSGESCWPVLVSGRAYWASAWIPVRAGDFVVFSNPAHSAQVLVKKILGVRENGYEVESLVSWGLSSKDFGVIGKQHVLGKVIRWNTK